MDLRTGDLPLKPTRRTHPMRPNNPSKNPRRLEPFDPHDLYRRLEKYERELARAQEPQKGSRKAKAEKPTSPEAEKPMPPQAEKSIPPQEYRHVPRYAAADFVKTASPDRLERQEIHPLSCAAIRMPPTRRPPKDARMSRYIEEQDLALQQVMVRADRNQFTRTPRLEAAAEADDERNLYKTPRRDFEPLVPPKEARAKLGSKLKYGALSPTLEPVDEIAEFDVVPRPRPYRPDDRCDWAQRDDNVQPVRRGFRHHIFPSLRKTAETKAPQLDTTEQEKKVLRRRSTFLIF